MWTPMSKDPRTLAMSPSSMKMPCTVQAPVGRSDGYEPRASHCARRSQHQRHNELTRRTPRFIAKPIAEIKSPNNRLTSSGKWSEEMNLIPRVSAARRSVEESWE